LAVDLYPDEEGHISDGLIIGYCKAVDAIVQNQAVKLGITSVAGAVSVVACTGDGDSVGVALKAAAANEWVPVCFYGVVKMYAGDTLTAGGFIMNDSSGIYVLPIPTYNTLSYALYYAANFTSGTIYRLGMALQNGNSAATGGELLVLIGGYR